MAMSKFEVNKPIKCKKCGNTMLHIVGKYRCHKCGFEIIDKPADEDQKEKPSYSSANILNASNSFSTAGGAQIQESSSGGMKCRKCGCDIPQRGFCDKCVRELSNGIRIAFQESRTNTLRY